MKKPLFFASLAFLCTAAFSQAPDIQWQKSLGGSFNEWAFSIDKTNDNGSIMVGETSSADGDITGQHGAYDCWVVKLNGDGTMAWQKTLGGSGSDTGNCVKQTNDGGYIIAGNSNSNDGDATGNPGNYPDFWIVKLTATGSLQWQKSFGGTNGDWAYSIQQTADNGYVVTGLTESNNGDVTGSHGFAGDAWVIKLNESGVLQWQKALGGNGFDRAHAVHQTTDGGYIVAGETRSDNGDVTGNHGGSDFWVVKINSLGVLEWQKCLGGSKDETANDVAQTTDGGYILTGYSNSSDGDVTGSHGSGDFWTVKLNATGSIEWQKSHGGTAYDYAQSICPTADGNYIVAGYTSSNNGDVTENKGLTDFWIVKLNTAGTMLWQKSYGGTGTDLASSIQQAQDGGYIITGESNANGGDVSGNHGEVDFWTIKIAPDVLHTQEFNRSDLVSYPNPASQRITIANPLNGEKATVEVFAANGAKVMEQEVSETQKTITLDISQLSKGTYIYKMNNYTNKFIKN